jgi:hypothetical protein
MSVYSPETRITSVTPGEALAKSRTFLTDGESAFCALLGPITCIEALARNQSLERSWYLERFYVGAPSADRLESSAGEGVVHPSAPVMGGQCRDHPGADRPEAVLPSQLGVQSLHPDRLDACGARV